MHLLFDHLFEFAVAKLNRLRVIIRLLHVTLLTFLQLKERALLADVLVLLKLQFDWEEADAALVEVARVGLRYFFKRCLALIVGYDGVRGADRVLVDDGLGFDLNPVIDHGSCFDHNILAQHNTSADEVVLQRTARLDRDIVPDYGVLDGHVVVNFAVCADDGVDNETVGTDLGLSPNHAPVRNV